MGSGEEWIRIVLDQTNGRNVERSIGAWLGLELKRRGWARWRAAEALGVRLTKLIAWLNDRAEPNERERKRITEVFGAGLPGP